MSEQIKNKQGKSLCESNLAIFKDVLNREKNAVLKKMHAL